MSESTPLRVYVASGVIIIIPAVLLLLTFTGVSSNLLPAVCDPDVEISAKQVTDPPGDATVYNDSDEFPYDVQLYVNPAVQDGLHRRCTLKNAIELKNWVEFGDIESKDTIYYRYRNQWYRIEIAIEMPPGQPF